MKKIICNWKMNPNSLDKVNTIIQAILNCGIPVGRSELIILPPTLYISTLQQYQSQLFASLGVQDISDASEGAYTSQISAEMVYNLGLEYALIGHSETRMYQHYSADIVAQKCAQALQHNLIPILCVGYEDNPIKGEVNIDLIKTELTSILSINHSLFQDKHIIIAYEPIWAIGTGIVPSIENIETVSILIKRLFQDTIPHEYNTTVSVVYGGSVNKDNIQSLKTIPAIDGFLIGSASLDIEQIPILLT